MEIVITAGSLLRRLVGDDIELVILTEQRPTFINASATQIEQILVNLSVNARDAMPDGGKLIIETTADTNTGQDSDVAAGEYVRLTIRDTGIGMTNEMKTHIFDPFFTTKGVSGGNGLGLSICYGIIQGHGGEIQVYSEPGHGSSFDIYFPLVEQPAGPMDDGQSVSNTKVGSETILLVDDDRIVREAISIVLRHFGYVVLEAGDGNEALRIADEFAGSTIDLLMTDVVMPNMGGEELTSKFLKVHNKAKVLYTSGYTNDEAIDHGAKVIGPFLQKPYTPETLALKVREVLEQDDTGADPRIRGHH